MMLKKSVCAIFCSVIRIFTMVAIDVLLHDMYNVGPIGFILVGVVGATWAITEIIERN